MLGRALVVPFVSTATPRVVTGGAWRGRRMRCVLDVHEHSRTKPGAAGGRSNVVVFAKDVMSQGPVGL
jgi:hypothetical protein